MFTKHNSSWAPYRPPEPRIQSDTLKTAEVAIDRKTFIFSLKENIRGQCLAITESNGARRNMIVVPREGLAEFARALAEMIKADSEFEASQK